MADVSGRSALKITLQYADPEHVSLLEIADHLAALGSLVEISERVLQQDRLTEDGAGPVIRLSTGSVVVELINQAQSAWLVQVLALTGILVRYGRGLANLPNDVMNDWLEGKVKRAELRQRLQEIRHAIKSIQHLDVDVSATRDIEDRMNIFPGLGPRAAGVTPPIPTGEDPTLVAIAGVIETLLGTTPSADTGTQSR
ncbi:hypothetical protein [Paractinoplanes hotanensis]|uniref:Uncharacterized protein n=1 Tax=Paractinoplanes hotanensis TaxID=2906497 RepID=A0ABT0XZK7_9ACTN|nr:hypothetical protein [Actinoplanes hotanensis]MCM4079225.1 hypothetical protein [Actinoplanes hotanensis]